MQKLARVHAVQPKTARVLECETVARWALRAKRKSAETDTTLTPVRTTLPSTLIAYSRILAMPTETGLTAALFAHDCECDATHNESINQLREQDGQRVHNAR